jgi:hypothetical protein
VIERIAEVLGLLLVLLRSLLLILRTRTTLSTVAMTLTTVTTIGTTVATISALRTLTTLTTTLLRLYIALGLLDEHTMREFVLARLRIDLKEFHLNMVTLLDTSLLDSLEALPVNLGDMEQTILARHDLDEAAVRMMLRTTPS